MTAKYITASVLSVRKIFGPLRIPRWNGLKICVCTTTSTKTTMSKGTGRELGSRNGWIRGSKNLTKEQREGDQNGYPTFSSIVTTHLIRFQRNRRYRH